MERADELSTVIHPLFSVHLIIEAQRNELNQHHLYKNTISLGLTVFINNKFI